MPVFGLQPQILEERLTIDLTSRVVVRILQGIPGGALREKSRHKIRLKPVTENMNVQRSSKIGEAGEQMACDFLLSRGHQILDRNWRSGHLELDIVSEGPDGLHFVEVKARMAPVTTATMTDQVNTVKRKRISAAALQYLNKKHLAGKEVYFDIVSVMFDGKETVVRYFPQAWIPMYV